VTTLAHFRDGLLSVGWELLWSTTYQLWVMFDYRLRRYERQRKM